MNPWNRMISIYNYMFSQIKYMLELGSIFLSLT